jgi:hypothetical protein
MHAEVAFTGRLLDAGANCPALQAAMQPPSNGQDRAMVGCCCNAVTTTLYQSRGGSPQMTRWPFN